MLEHGLKANRVVPVIMGGHYMIKARRAAIKDVNVFDDSVAGGLKSAVDNVDILLATDFVADAYRITAALGLDIQKINLKEVSHMRLHICP
jgi:hypothetical protein